MASNPYANKVALADGRTLIDISGDTVAANKMLSGVTAHDKSGVPVNGTIAIKSASNVTFSGTTISVAEGYYPSAVSKAISGVTIQKPSSGTNTFSITVPDGSGTITFVFNVDSSGNVTITET